MIEVSGLTKYYSGSAAVKDISFTIGQGEIVGLLGLNGAGKSTVLKMLGCFLLPSSGTARVAGFDVNDDPQAIRRNIGYLPDTPPVYNEMTVLRYIRYVAALKDVPAADLEMRIDFVVRKTQLADVLDMTISELSHGFRQRVSIAQALIHNPPVLILDEPINGLDPVQIVEMRDLILSLRGEHTVILSSHILSEITRTCDRILILDHGQLVAQGKESELESRFVKGMRIFLDLDREDAALLAQLRGLHGMRFVERRGPIAGGTRFVIETEKDIRGEIAKTVVNAHVALLGLGREDAGLEGLFMKLVHSKTH